MRFSDRAYPQEIRGDVIGKIRRFMSVGAKPQKYKQTKVAQNFNEMSEIRITRWQPREATITSVPADQGALITRSADGITAVMAGVELETDAPVKEERSMSQPVETPAAPAAAPAAPAPAAVVTRSAGEELANRNKEIGEILKLCRSYQVPDKAEDFISRGLSLTDAKLEIFHSQMTPGGRGPAAEVVDGLTKKERRVYSIQRALRAQLNLREGRAQKLEGLEGEVSAALERTMPQSSKRMGGILIPYDLRTDEEILQQQEEGLVRRTMDSKTGAKGAELVSSVRGQLIELIQQNAILTRLGANILGGLSAPITFPRETGAPTVSFVGENPGSDVSETDATTGELDLTPKQMIGAVKMSRTLILETGGQAQDMIDRRLRIGTELALDRAGFHGLSSNGQPTGLYNLAGVLAVAMGSVAPTWIKITDMLGAVGDQNIEGGRLGFATTQLMAARLLSTLMFSVNGSQTIWSGRLDGGLIGGYPSIGSTQIRKNLGSGADEHGFVYGSWDMCTVGLFGAVEVLVDPYTGALQGLVKIRSFGYGDIIFQHPEAFCVGTAAKVA